MQDLDKPHCYGACWGEVMAQMHRAFGCIGTITDGAIRDVEWMTAAGFKAIARRLAVGHGNYCPVRWNCPVEVFGVEVKPGQLIHADQQFTNTGESKCSSFRLPERVSYCCLLCFGIVSLKHFT